MENNNIKYIWGLLIFYVILNGGLFTAPQGKLVFWNKVV